MMIYLLKIEGKAKIPDYVQLRDKDYNLLAYFRVDRPEKALEKCGFENKMDDIKKFIDAMPFGEVQSLEL